MTQSHTTIMDIAKRGNAERSKYGWTDNPVPYKFIVAERSNQFKVPAAATQFPTLAPRICHWLG